MQYLYKYFFKSKLLGEIIQIDTQNNKEYFPFYIKTTSYCKGLLIFSLSVFLSMLLFLGFVFWLNGIYRFGQRTVLKITLIKY